MAARNMMDGSNKKPRRQRPKKTLPPPPMPPVLMRLGPVNAYISHYLQHDMIASGN